MCGIIGVVGHSKNEKISHILSTNLLNETKSRGKDATGHFRVDTEGNTEMFKIPVSSDEYIRFYPWKRTAQNTRTIIGHCRWKTHGNPSNNSNNHPFVNKSGNLALVHNGKIEAYEKLKKNYPLTSECDSEIILSIISRENNILQGIHKVYNLLGPKGDFACEVIYRNPKNGKSKFFFFRETGRPGYFIDCTKKLGQYFFCSTEQIWNDAVKTSNLEEILDECTPEEIPPYEIWEIDTASLNIKKTRIKGIIKEESQKYQGTYWNWNRWTNKSNELSITSLKYDLGYQWDYHIINGNVTLTYDSEKKIKTKWEHGQHCFE